MRSHLLKGIVFISCSSFLSASLPVTQKSDSDIFNSGKNIFDFTVHRLSGERVMISWHTQGEPEQIKFEVMRKHGRGIPFASLGIVEAKSKENNSADYSFIDINNFPDSTFYCLKKTDLDSVVFYSITKGIDGAGKER